MSVIEAQCTDQTLTLTSTPVIAAGGKNEDVLKVEFCEVWNGYAKTAVFYQDESKIYYSVFNENNTCVVPHEATAKEGAMYLGVFGVKGDTRITSCVMRYKIKKGAWVEDATPSDPSTDIYEQLLANYAEIIAKVNQSYKDQADFISDANNAVVNCEQAYQDCYDAIGVLNHTAEDMDGGDPSTEDSAEEADDINGGTPN